MANETTITVIGNATRPELRFTPAGKAVCNFALASQPRTFDKQRNEWVDGETLWLNCAAWGPLGENLIEAIGDQKSLRLVVTGRLKSRNYETKDGSRRTVFEIDVEDCGPSLKFATAQVQRTQRQPGAQPAQHGRDPWAQTHHDQRGQQRPAGRDPWAGGNNDTPPF